MSCLDYFVGFSLSPVVHLSLATVQTNKQISLIACQHTGTLMELRSFVCCSAMLFNCERVSKNRKKKQNQDNSMVCSLIPRYLYQSLKDWAWEEGSCVSVTNLGI